MSRFRAACAVAGPTAAIKGRAGCAERLDFNSQPRRKTKRTAFWLVKITQSNSANRRSAASNSAEFSGGAKLTIGNWRTSAPSASNSAVSSCACSGARVFTTIFPDSGSLCNGPSRKMQQTIGTRPEKLASDFFSQGLGVVLIVANLFPAAAKTFGAVGGEHTSIKNHLARLDSRPGPERQPAPALHVSEQRAFGGHGAQRILIHKLLDKTELVFTRHREFHGQSPLPYGGKHNVRR